MAVRLPIPGQDDYVWGDILNDFLMVAHAGDGQLKPLGVSTTHLADGAVTAAKLDADITTTLATKLDKPANPSATALVQVDADGVVSTLSKQTYWQEAGDWVAGTFYNLNAIVKYTSNGYTRYFRCSNAHTAGVSFDFAKFVNVSMQEASMDTRYLVRPFAISTYYLANQLATNVVGGDILLYRAKAAFTSGASFNIANWDLVGSAGGGGPGTSLVVPNVQTAAYTLGLSDAGKAIEVNTAAAVVVTVPPSSSAAFAVGTVIEIFQRGAGQVTVSPGAGVTFRTASTNLLRAQFSVATLRLSATDEWVLAGDLA